MKDKKKMLFIVALFGFLLLISNIYFYKRNITYINYYSHPDKTGALSKMVKKFEIENPDIKVNLIELPDNTDDKFNVISSALERKDKKVDIIDSDVIWPTEFIANDWVEPLGKYFTKEELDGFLEGALKANVFKGKLYGIPYRIDLGMLYYRKDLLEKYNKEIPKTWEELIEISKEIMDKEKIFGFGGSWDKFEGLTCNALEYVWSAGGKVLNEEGDVEFYSKEADEGLKIMNDILNEHKIVPREALTFSSGNLRELFYDGNLIFMRDWSSGWNHVQDESKSKVVGKVGVTSLPFVNDNNEHYSTLGGWQMMLAKHSNKKEASIKFIKFMTSEEVQKKVSIENGYIPSRKNLYKNEEILEKMPFISQILEQLQNVKSRPKSRKYTQISAIIQDEVMMMLLNKKNNQEALKSADRRIKKLLYP